MPTPTQTYHALTSYYIKKFKEHYGRQPIVNRNTAKWGWQAILMDADESQARELVDYYFTTKSTHGHDLDWLLRNYSDYQKALEASKADAAARERLRKESEERAAAWRERFGNQGTRSN